MDSIDIIICILPKIEPKAPTIGPNLLKSHLKQAGFSCFVHDLNIELYKSMVAAGQENYYNNDDVIFRGDHSHVTPEFNALMEQHKDLVDSWISKWQSKNPKYIGLSIFSISSQQIAMFLSEKIRKKMPGVKIIWGGPHATFWGGTFNHVENGLLDHYIYGDAEQSLVSLMQGNLTAPGIDSTIPNQFDMSKMLIPDYSDIDMGAYRHPNGSRTANIYVTASRGCVKRCTFCDVYEIWPEYMFRSGRAVAEEIIALRQKYGNKMRHFFFTDSLINGSMKAFRELLEHLIEYRKVDSDWYWISQYIMRPVNQSPEEDFALMKASGCASLDIGIESFSESVRYHMGKKFKDEDMWWTFEMMNKYGIGGSLMGFIGYPTETEADHQINLDTFRKIHSLGYLDPSLGEAKLRPSFGGTMIMDKNMPIYRKISKDLIYYHTDIDWAYGDHDFNTRARRLAEILDLCDTLLGESYLTSIMRRNRNNIDLKAQGIEIHARASV